LIPDPFFEVKSNDVQLLKACTGEAMSVVTHSMVQNTWIKIQYLLIFIVPAGVSTLISTNTDCSQKKMREVSFATV
jgi:hypothetical protein